MANKFDKVEEEIKEILENIAKELSEEESSKKWTKRIKDEICNLGERFGYNADASGYKDASEWLFDLIWTDNKDNYFLELILAMECEWDTSDDYHIWVDFEKLLIPRAKYRVFIFQQSSQDKVRKFFNEMKEAIRKFRSTQTNDRYLLAGFCFDTAEFLYDSYIHK